MPPAAWHEYGLPWVLDALNHVWQFTIWMTLRLLQPRKYEIEVVNSFVVLSLVHQMFSPHKLFGYSRSWWPHNPSFMALNRGVPRWSTQRILMYFTARPLRPNEKPSVRRHLILWHTLVQVMCKELRQCVIILHYVSFWVFLEAALEQVKWWVIAPIENVFHVLF